jgi:hypothetical protein
LKTNIIEIKDNVKTDRGKIRELRDEYLTKMGVLKFNLPRKAILNLS